MPKKRAIDVKSWSLEKRQEILRKNPEINPRDLGILPEAPAKKAVKSRAKKTWRGTISFDSETEATVYDRLLTQHKAVIAHGKIALGEEAHLEPDFIIVHEVRPDGTFVGELADAKAVWTTKTKAGNKTSKAHWSDKWDIKVKWLKAQLGLIMRVVTK